MIPFYQFCVTAVSVDCCQTDALMRIQVRLSWVTEAQQADGSQISIHQTTRYQNQPVQRKGKSCELSKEGEGGDIKKFFSLFLRMNVLLLSLN